MTEKAKRQRFNAEYKRRIVTEAASCTKAGEAGALLRCEGLYSLQLGKWRELVEQAEIESLRRAKKRGRKANPVDARDKKIADLERKVARLAARAERAETLVEVQKNFHDWLGSTCRTPKSRSHERGRPRRRSENP